MFSSISGNFRAYVGKLGILVGAIALMLFAWANLFFHVNTNAYAATMEGVRNEATGMVDEGIGKVERAKGDIIDDPELEAKGAAQQLKGNAKQGFGKVENKLDNAQDTLEDKSESLIDSVKDFFD